MTANESHFKLAESYFAYLAHCFPVMCASDEFHFMPRAQSAADYYDRLDDLGSQAIERSIANLKKFRDEFARLAERNDSLEDRIDLELLQANSAGILIELEQKHSWQYNPLLYLKIAFIGLDHAFNKPAANPAERIERVLSRLAEVPRLLKQAVININSIPQSYHQASRLMLMDCRQYLTHVGTDLLDLIGRPTKLLSACLANAMTALTEVNDYLATVSVKPDGHFASDTLRTTLDDHFLSVRSLEDIYQIAVEDWQINLEQLERLGSKINPTATWQELYHEYLPSEINTDDTLLLYREEINRLRLFFSRLGFSKADLNRTVEILETPYYLRSVRGSASFAAAFSANESEKSYFYITTHLPHHFTDQAGALLKRRFHREYKMLTAHETIPGHHFLDSIRRRLKNPVRRQIESPLFYEGWASYAEFLLIDAGYVHIPMDLLVDLKRRLWRSARCQVDVGLTTNRIKVEEAVHLLKVCGFSVEEARRQIDRFRLNPGYQLCYCLGCYEFKQLNKIRGKSMNKTEFHSFLLEGGELPFHLIQKRFDAQSNTTSKE